jgi:hypothetical protein
LIAQKYFGPLVAHEQACRGAELRSDARKHRPLADGQKPSARPGELHHDRGGMLGFHASDHVP